MNGNRYLPPFLAELWTAVAAIGKPMSVNDYRRQPEIGEILRTYHETAKGGLEQLARTGYLRMANESRFQTRYWWSTACKVPYGCQPPGQPLATGTEKAALRAHVNAVMPNDTTPLMQPMSGPAFDFLKCPSRRGDRLVYRDGRVTDLEGNPL